MFSVGIGLTSPRYLTGKIAMPAENLILLFIVTGAMAIFMLVTVWLSLDRNKLPRDIHNREIGRAHV